MKNEFTLKLISIFIGFSGAFFVLEIFARILPAANIIGLEKPIRCEDLNYINQDCLHRRRKKISFRYTKGKYPPFEIDAIKSTNDIGQFSNIDFFEFVSYESNLDKKRILTVGDSQVEALQVENKETFHDLFNNSERKFDSINQIKNSYISTSIGSSGMALPNYIQSLKYALNHTSLDSDIVLISIQSNDFDESFKKYAIKGRRSGRGQFYFDLLGNIEFEEYPPENLLGKLISISLRNSSLIRYLTYNIEVFQKIDNLKINCFLKNNPSSCNHKNQRFASNIVDESYDQNPERYDMGYKATKFFLNELSELRQTDLMKKNTILIVDADRGFINSQYPQKGLFFDSQRKFLIKNAIDKGFTVIDLEDDFSEKFRDGLTFNSSIDAHWNASGHKIVFEAVLREINKIISN